MLEIIPLILGPVSTNCYLIGDTQSGAAAVIDPAWDGRLIQQEAQRRGWKIQQLWYTHAHFDHFGGAAELAGMLEATLQVGLHPEDRDLWEAGGLGKGLGYQVDRYPEPSLDLSKTKSLSLGEYRFLVRHAPGHTPGSCIFYCAQEGLLFSGDLIFCRGVGRTDLPGGDWETILTSIRNQVYTLPDETRILPGHGEETSVLEEKRSNPFIRG